eukprot:GHVU01078708.1.p3 GENE.GHVU01078708.1~~GHVU01078708.1.p3  ORF type:complete len:147 (-),score=6.12 GHVU01078708.1:259-699(-)
MSRPAKQTSRFNLNVSNDAKFASRSFASSRGLPASWCTKKRHTARASVQLRFSSRQPHLPVAVFVIRRIIGMLVPAARSLLRALRRAPGSAALQSVTRPLAPFRRHFSTSAAAEIAESMNQPHTGTHPRMPCLHDASACRASVRRA